VGALLGGAAKSFGKGVVGKLGKAVKKPKKPQFGKKNKKGDKKKRRDDRGKTCGCAKCAVKSGTEISMLCGRPPKGCPASKGKSCGCPKKDAPACCQYHGEDGAKKLKECREKNKCATRPKKTKAAQCFVGGVSLWSGDGTREPIRDARLGMRVLTWLKGEVGYWSAEGVAIDRATHRAVWVVQEQEGVVRKVGLLRSREWLAAQGIRRVGDRVRLELRELDVDGLFQVMAIE